MTNGEAGNPFSTIGERVREALLEAERRGSEFVDEAERRAAEITAEAEERATRIVADAEREASERAAAIVADADRKAEETVSLAESQAHEHVERTSKALEELSDTIGRDTASLESSLRRHAEGFGGGVADPLTAPDAPAAEEPEAELAEPELAAEPEEPEPDEPEPTEPEDRAPEPEVADSPTTEQLIDQLKGGDAEIGEDASAADAAARLVAWNMVLEGASREEVDRHLAEGHQVADREALLDEVFSRVGR